MKTEKESHEALIRNNGRPCYPIELGFDIFNNPGQYKDILEYWQKGQDELNKRLIFSAQWFEWKEFRSRQRGNRQHYVPRNLFFKFQEVLQERRRKHGLDGDLHLCEEVADQSKLEDWMEYQNYELRKYEAMEERLKKAQERLTYRRKALAKEGYSAFEEIEGLEFGQYFGKCQAWAHKVGEAKQKQKMTERKLTVAKTRLKAAQSEELGDMVERDRWIGWLEKEVASRQTRMDELKRLADEAKQNLELYEQWLKAKEREIRATDREGYWTDEVQRLFEVQARTVEYREKAQKRDKLKKRALEAGLAYHGDYGAKREVEIAEEALKAARTEDLAPTVERVALIRRTQKEVQFAEFHVEEEKESTRMLDLKWGVQDELYNIPKLREDMKELKVLLDWIEGQRRELSASTGQKSGPKRSTRVSPRAHPDSRVTETSVIDRPAKKRAPPRKRSKAKSILDPMNPAKIFKNPKKKRKNRRMTSVPHDIPQAVDQMNVDFNITEPKCDVAAPVKDGMRTRLRPIRSSRISKPASKRSIGQQRDTKRLSPIRDGHRRTGKDPVDVSTLSSEVVDESMKMNMQRSTRGLKRLQSRCLRSR